MVDMVGNKNVSGKIYPRARIRNAVVSKYLVGKVLDVGCSDRVGQFDSMPLDYVGIDPDVEAVERLQGKGINAVVGSVYDLDKMFSLNSFDTVICLGVLTHLQNVGLAVEQIEKVLKPSGLALFSLHNAYDIQRILHKDFKDPEDYHYQVFTEEHFQNLLEDNGLKIVKLYHIPNFWFSRLVTRINPRYCDDLLFVTKKVMK